MAKSTAVGEVFPQTIALIRYELLEIVNRRLLFTLAGIVVLVLIAGQFVQGLALINRATIALAAQAELLRYVLVALMMISMCHHTTNHYEQRFFSRLLSMPVPRYRYVLAQFFVVLLLALLYALPVLFIMSYASVQHAIYWYGAVSLELILVGLIAVLMSMSLERLTPALLSTLAFYLFCKSLPLILFGLERSATVYDEDVGFQFLHGFMIALSYLMPQHSAFAVNNLIFESTGFVKALTDQLLAVLVYGAFLQGVTLIDFYRKELNET